jgi:hypothetical protein
VTSTFSDIEGADASFILGHRLRPRRLRHMVIALHDGDMDGRRVTPRLLLDTLVSRWGFRLLAMKNKVAALTR